MASFIARVLSRLGLESAIKTQTFGSGEVVLASDTNRVVVGDGVLLGGRSLTPINHTTLNLSTIKDNVFVGDTILYKNILYRSRVSGFIEGSLTLADLESMSSEGDNITIARDTSGFYTLKDGGISSIKINSSVLGDGITRTGSGPIRLNLNPLQFEFDETGQVNFIGSVSGSAVRFDAAQTLTDEEKSQVRDNIDAPSFEDSIVSTGITYFEGLFINADVTKFDRGEVRGWISTQETSSSPPTVTRFVFPRVNGITSPHIATAAVTLVAIDSDGNLVMQTGPFTTAQRRSLFLLGQITHVDFATITKAAARPNILPNIANRFEGLCAALGPFNTSGNVFSPAGTDLTMQKSSGTIFSVSANYQIDTQSPDTTTLAALNPCTIQHVTRNTVTSINTTIDPNNWDNNGILTTVTNSRFTIQRIYHFADNNLAVTYGQAQYTTLAAAQAAVLSEQVALLSSVQTFGILRGWIILAKGTTDLSNPANCLFITAGKFVGY